MNKSLLYFSFLLILLQLSLTGCGRKMPKVLGQRYLDKPLDTLVVGNRKSNQIATLQYTGCGGFMLSYSGERILLDPYFTNFSMMEILFCRYKTDTVSVNRFFKNQLGKKRDTAAEIKAILISHAHHDHLGDVPALFQNNLAADKVNVYGSQTMVNLLRSFPELLKDTATQLIDLERHLTLLCMASQVNSPTKISPFFYTPGGRIRFAAISSEHAGHYKICCPHKLPCTQGEIKQPRTKPPRHALNFKEGQNFNYLIDLLDENNKPIFRIFSNGGAACDYGVGFPPECLLQEKSVDLLIICGANYNLAKNYPLPLLEYLQPRILFVGHWENFFKPIPNSAKKPKTVPSTNICKLMDSLEQFSKEHDFPQEILMKVPLASQVTLKF